jgi:hypothetical protein
LPISKNVHPFAPHTRRIGFETQSDRTVLPPARVVVSAARVDCEFRLEREHGIVVEIARGEYGVELVLDRVADRVLEGFERGAP